MMANHIQSNIVVFSTLIMFLKQLQIVGSQTCSTDAGCFSQSKQLLNSSFPSRSLDVSSTCGANGLSTPFCTMSTPCDGSNPPLCSYNPPHTKEYMFDMIQNQYSYSANFHTYWQSANTIASSFQYPVPQYITVNFTDAFLILRVVVTFATPLAGPNDFTDMRPLALSIQGQNSLSGSWQIWRAYSSNCSWFYPNLVEQKANGNYPSYNASTTVCIEKYYGGDSSTNSMAGYGLQEVRDVHFSFFL